MKSALALVKDFQANGVEIVEGSGESEAICRQYLTDDFVNAVELFTVIGAKIKSIEVFHFDPAGIVATLLGTWRY